MQFEERERKQSRIREQEVAIMNKYQVQIQSRKLTQSLAPVQ